jgi:HlyD family secretion protein
MMRRALIVTVTAAAAALAGLWAATAVAPCVLPSALMDKIAPGKAAACPAAARAQAQAQAQADEPRVVEPPAVTVVPAAKREFVDRLFVSGTLVAREEAQVAARIDGLAIVELDAEDGDHVRQGQVLARLDRSQLDAQLAQNDAATKRADAAIDQARSLIAQSQAQAQFASADFDRARKLGDGVMAASTIEQRQTAMKTAEAQLAAAQFALGVAEADRKSRDAERRELLVRIDRTEVKAPVAGIVSRRSARLGAAASASGEPLFRIIEDGAIDLEADVPEQQLARLAVGMTAELKLPGVDKPVAGRVRLVNQEVDRASRTGKVRIALGDVSHAHVGAFASGSVELARREGVGVPATALQREGEEARLDVVRNGKVESRQVKAGIVDGDWVEVLSGVADGESVVARAAAFLRPGDRVRPTPGAGAANG